MTSSAGARSALSATAVRQVSNALINRRPINLVRLSAVFSLQPETVQMAPLFLYKFDENTASRRVYDETALKSAKNCGLAALYMVDSDVISFQLVSAAILWVKFLEMFVTLMRFVGRLMIMWTFSSTD